MIDVEILLSAYASGWFPMAVAPGEIRWYSPDPRGIIPLDTFHVPSRLARVVGSGRFEIRIDADFLGVMRGCAERRGPEGTWIDDEIFESYVALHHAGFAHSVEAWQQGRLVGGLYGVALGAAFFGESMFHRVADASKVALVALVDRLRANRFLLLDTQWVTEHLQQFGATDIPRRRYLKLLAEAIDLEASFSE